MAINVLFLVFIFFTFSSGLNFFEKIFEKFLIEQTSTQTCPSVRFYFEILRSEGKCSFIDYARKLLAKDEIVLLLDEMDLHIQNITLEVAYNKKTPIERLEKLGKIVRKIKSKQLNPFRNEAPINRSQSAEIFYEWCESMEITIESVTLREHPLGFGLGIFATKKLQPNDIVIIVPRKSILRRKLFIQEFRNIIPSFLEMWQLPIALKLITERLKPKGAGDWRPYVDMLPRNYETHPLMFEPEDFFYLQDSVALKSTIDGYMQLLANYGMFYRFMKTHPKLFSKPNLLNLKTLTFSSYFWAMIAVISRAMSLGNDDTGLLPFWDMINHGRHENSKIFGVEDSLMQKMTKVLEPGDELRHHYKHSCDTANFFSVWNINSPDDEFCQIRATVEKKYRVLLVKLRKMPEYRDITVNGNSEIPIPSADDQAYVLVIFGPANMGQWPETPLSTNIWQRAWKKFGELITNYLKDYKKSLDENEKFLAGQQHLLSVGAQRCITQVISEQKVLTKVLAATQKLIEWNETQIADFGDRLKTETTLFKTEFHPSG